MLQALTGMAASAPDVLKPHAQALVHLLLSQLTGRLWQGKAALLTTIAAITVHCQSEFTTSTPGTVAHGTGTVAHGSTASGAQNPQQQQQQGVVSDADVVSALVFAAQKRAVEYRDGALAALETVLEGLKGRDHLGLLGPVLEAAQAPAPAGAPRSLWRVSCPLMRQQSDRV